MSILDEFGEHECEVCGTDCVAVEEMLESKDKRIADLTAALEAAHAAGELGGWEDCPEEDNCLCCDAWRKARTLRDTAINAARKEQE